MLLAHGGLRAMYNVLNQLASIRQIDLVRGNITQDAAVLRFAEEPIGARRDINAVWPQPHSLHNTANCPRVDQFTGLHRSAVINPFAEVDRVDTLRFSLDAPRFG